MSTVIPNHAHCRVCGRAVAFGKESCSPEHQKQLDDLVRRKKNMMYLFYAAMGVFLLLFVLQLRGGV